MLGGSRLLLVGAAEDVLAPVEHQLEGHPADDPDEEVGDDGGDVVEQTLLGELGFERLLPNLHSMNNLRKPKGTIREEYLSPLM